MPALARQSGAGRQNAYRNACLSPSARIAVARRVAGIPLSHEVRRAIQSAHKVGQGERGSDGRPAQIFPNGTGNFTWGQKRRKAAILRSALRRVKVNGNPLSKARVRKITRRLMDHGVVGLGRFLTSYFLDPPGVYERKRRHNWSPSDAMGREYKSTVPAKRREQRKRAGEEFGRNYGYGNGRGGL
jgi:hypothetical protein